MKNLFSKIWTWLKGQLSKLWAWILTNFWHILWPIFAGVLLFWSYSKTYDQPGMVGLNVFLGLFIFVTAAYWMWRAVNK